MRTIAWLILFFSLLMVQEMYKKNELKLFQRKENTLTIECLVFGKLKKEREKKKKKH